MAASISFGTNEGVQVGVNHGSVTTNHFYSNQDVLDKLPVAYGAEFESYVDQHEERCLPGTRTELLQRIMTWASSPGGKTLFWLNGMAGTGKSTIARTVAYALKEKGILGASFFFKRGEGDRGSALRLFPTLARQLALKVPALAPELEKATKADPDVAFKALREQFEKLLLDPLLALSAHATSTTGGALTIAVVLDALDECEKDEDVRAILHLLPRLQKTSYVNVRILLTSRPELPIRLGFQQIEAEYEDLILHEVPEAVTAKDISLYLNHRLAIIRQERALPVDWPPAEEIESIVKISVPLFIFAATVCRVVEDPYSDPVDNLTEIISDRCEGSQLVATYLPIFSRILKLQARSNRKEEQMIREFREIIGGIVMLEDPLPIQALSRLLDIPERVFRMRLNALHSVIYIPHDESSPIRPFHLSFRDFLLDPEIRDRTPFWVDDKETHHQIAVKCISICTKLRRDICNLQDPAAQRKDLDPKKIEQCIPRELQYSCRFWARHLLQSSMPTSLISTATSFLQRYFLYWVEAMSILGLTSDIIIVLDQLEETINSENAALLGEFLHDAKLFVNMNWQICNKWPLQVYFSGLLFSPATSLVCQSFKHEFPDWNVLIDGPNISGIVLRKLEGHSGLISSLVFSADERLIASSSSDGTINIWDVNTGTLRQSVETLAGARSLSFSPDGKSVAFIDFSWRNDSELSSTSYSTSENYGVFLLDVATGDVQEMSSNPISDMDEPEAAFVPNRQEVVWSSNRAITLYSIKENSSQIVLDGSFEGPLAFSQDGRLMALSCSNRTVQIWNTHTWSLEGTAGVFEFPVSCMRLSSDATFLVVELSRSGGITVWDLATNSVRSRLRSMPHFRFDISPVGHLATSDILGGLTIWDVPVLRIPKSIPGHTRPVTALSFSRSGRTLATGSSDKDILLWSTKSFLSTDVDRFTRRVLKVDVSPSGLFAASAFSDGTIGIWDATASRLTHILVGHSSHASFMDFAPHAPLLASASAAKVRIWNIMTGKLVINLDDPSLGILAIKWTDRGQTFMVLSDSNDDNGPYKVFVWETTTWTRQLEDIDITPLISGNCACRDPSDHVITAVFSPLGDHLAIALCESLVTVKLGKEADFKILPFSKRGPNRFQKAISYSQDGTFVALATSIARMGGDVRVELWDTTTGTLLHIIKGALNTKKFVFFSGDDSCLHTHLGTLDLAKWRPSGYYKSSRSACGFSMHDGRWVALNDEKVLCLPVSHWPDCVAAKNGTLIIGSSHCTFLLRPKS
ncbi:NACHT and WD40 domain protein [Penicillium chermesinum]|uniref:Mitochondrial division protein 1 n=1 Tax=Penicillium chermesinum TaxID=63820 RepID=A0A9W9TJV0_9EURO|nr:NACHT and WD40 domain protein [Penicillium chermesinum]KAJ5225471.1 NACHT and WD40 domain protein [Penicillium chermesinum]